METEYQVLNHLHENAQTSQRQISKQTGLSLGAVNLTLKKMARKGLIKIEKLNTRTVRYILTPQGLKEKTSLTYNYVRNSYRQIIAINNAVENLLQDKNTPENNHQIILYGPPDEIEQILKSALRTLNIKSETKRPGEDNISLTLNQLILTWRYEDEQTLPTNTGVVNIMNLI